MDSKKYIVGVIAVLGVFILGLAVGFTIKPQPVSDGQSIGGTTRSNTTVAANLAVTGDTTLSGGTLNVTTTNTATSTIIGGCFQFYATSTDTAHKFQASTTPGAMYSQYGACPNS